MDLSTTYLGLVLRSPLIVSSNPLNFSVENIKEMAEAGAGAVVLPSLFEEQIRLEESGFGTHHVDAEIRLPADLQYIADLQEGEEKSGIYLATLYKAKQVANIKVIASLNGRSSGGWLYYARLFERVGADALELNIYNLPINPRITGAEVEDNYVRLVKSVCASVEIPVSVKLGPYFSSLPHFTSRLVAAGAAGLVLFNRFYQPDFDLARESVVPNIVLSSQTELLLRLRWTAILYQRIKADLAITGGIHSGEDLVKSILAGAQVGMVASAVLKYGIDHLHTILADAERWMVGHGYQSIADMRGRLSQQRVANPAAFERANYMQTLHSYEITAD